MKQRWENFDDITLREFIDVMPIPGGVRVDTNRLVKVLRQKKLLWEKEAVREVRKRLSEFLEHGRDCILSQFSAGRPTDDGGYEVQFAGKWYPTRPVDKTPKCNCGLSKALKH